MSEEQQKTKDRSPNFPFINLEQSLMRAQQFYAAEKRGAAPFKVAAQHWSYSTSSSGAFQTAAALKSYGLMVDEGSGEKRNLKLTDLALRILLDQRPDSQDKPRYMRQAALSPTIAAQVYGKWPNGLPSLPSLHHYLVLDRGFGDQKAHSVSKIIYENEELTKHGASLVASSDAKIENEAQTEVGSEAMVAAPQEVVSHRIPSVTSGMGLPQTGVWSKPERLAFGNAEIIINYAGKPSAAVFGFIEKYMKLRIEMFELEQKSATSGDSAVGQDESRNILLDKT
jgi:hypothetical protein